MFVIATRAYDSALDASSRSRSRTSISGEATEFGGDRPIALRRATATFARYCVCALLRLRDARLHDERTGASALARGLDGDGALGRRADRRIEDHGLRGIA